MAASLAARSLQRLCLSAVRPQIKPRYLSTSSSLLAAQVQKPAPAFKAQAVVDGQFKEVSLEDYKGKYVVVYFYPLDFTFVCPTEIIAFSERIEEFKKINCEVVGSPPTLISPTWPGSSSLAGREDWAVSSILWCQTLTRPSP